MDDVNAGSRNDEVSGQAGPDIKLDATSAQMDTAAKPDSILAMLSMILGIVGILTFCLFGTGFGIAALVLGIIALVKIRKGEAVGRRMAITGICTGAIAASLLFIVVVMAILAGILLPALNGAREKARRISCASNLNLIGLALRQYAMDNEEFYPSGEGVPGLEMLRKGGYLADTKLFVCPSSGAVSAVGPLRAESVSYIYLGAGMNAGCKPDSVLVVEKPEDHSRYGNILFVDGHVQGFSGVDCLCNAGMKAHSKP